KEIVMFSPAVSNSTPKLNQVQESAKSINKCNFLCGRRVTLVDKSLPCSACKEIFCMNHRIPEQHQCKKLDEIKNRKKQELADNLKLKDPKYPKLIEDVDCDADCY